MDGIFIAAGVATAIGIICAVILILSSKFMNVESNEKESKIREVLPGANCGACGYAGCDGYAAALAEGKIGKTNLCVPGADAVSQKIAEITGLEAEDVIEKTAVVKCLGDCGATGDKTEYRGIKSCSAAKMLYGGKGKCTHGCIGFGDCANVCPSGAVCIKNGIAHINAKLCTGCGLCEKACPQHIISLMDDVDKALIACSNTEKGASVRNKCSRGCLGCKKCEKSCLEGAISVINNLASINYEKCINCGECAKNCPVGCIVISDFSGIHRYTVEK